MIRLSLSKSVRMSIDMKELLTVSFTLFAVIDIVGSIPLLIAMREKVGGIHSGKVTFYSAIFMVGFFFVGSPFLDLLGVDIHSFAVAGSIVIFILGLEMVLGVEFFKSDKNSKAGTIVPIAFPLIAGSGTLTTIMSLKATFERSDKNEWLILIAILLNLIVIFIVLHFLNRIEKLLGEAGLIAVRKFFGVILLAISVKIFGSNVGGLIK